MFFHSPLRTRAGITCLLLLGLFATAQQPKRFTFLNSGQTGIDFTNKVRDSKDRNILLYSNFYGGAGVGVGDFNGDGLQDIYFAGNLVPDQLYFNEGGLSFKQATKNAGIKDDGGWSTGVTVADVDNDGDLDIYVSRELYDDRPDLRANLLYINTGDGTFTEEAEKYGVADTQRTRHATFFDYDKDGFADLLLLTQPPNPGSYSKLSGSTLLLPEYHLKLLKNTGKGSFTEVSRQAGIQKTGFPNAVSASDLNGDGWTDLYIANDFYAPDFLYINNKDGTFTNTIDSAMGHIPYYSMGVDVADINNDALPDVFVVDMVAEDNFRLKSNMSGMNPDAFWKVVKEGGHYQYMYNALQLNNGNDTFSDIAQITGMAATDWSWSNLIADLDNDGLKDAYITNGLLHDIRNTDADKRVGQYITDTANEWVRNNPGGGDVSIWDILDLDKTISLMPSQPLQNYAFKNKGKMLFEKVMEEWGLTDTSFSNGSAFADFDNDGDLDLVVNNINQKAFLYRNNSESLPDANYLRVWLTDKHHRTTFGTKVKIYTGGEMQFYESTNVRGIYSTSEQAVHFGMGSREVADSLVVLWPNGKKTVIPNLRTNQLVNLDMDQAEAAHSEDTMQKKLLFTHQVPAPIPYKHQENDFDDYRYQVLLPHKLSQFGPALAIGDVNNDGLQDIFIGGATGFEAVLFRQDAAGGFSHSSLALWKKEAPYEDVDALFVDVNGDGFQDLYVVSGGNEYPANDLHYVDRLYLNDGTGNFSKGAILNVGRMSGSRVVAADYDQDGDTDLFVGGRIVPHQYPLPATSMLLINENGQLENRTELLAPELINIGMVTDAAWTDYDSDGDTDLVVVGEWMPVTILKNENGKLSKAAVPTLERTTGWWFSLDQGDFDKDGDMDLVAGNLGLNYKYKTSPEKPFDIYFNDFDTNGLGDIVLGYYNGDKHYPLRGFSCSAQQVPGLKQAIGKYDIFASMEIDAVYGSENLANSLHYKADTFASSYIENLGGGAFTISALPREAQLSNINDISIADFDGDRNMDLLVTGNLFVSEIETPRNDAGTGLLLLGNGNGEFKPVPGKDSGFLTRGDSRKMLPGLVGGMPVIWVANNNGALQVFYRSKELH